MGTVGEVHGTSVSVGNERLMNKIGIKIPESAFLGSEAKVYVACDGKYIGAILIADQVKKEAASTVSLLKKHGVSRTVMLTGDKRERAEKIASLIGIDEVKAELLPEDKTNELEKIIKATNGKTVYVGDGINDAPSITLSDVGISMGAIGTDSAIECSDVVITSDDLSRIPEAMLMARKTLRIARENIAIALGIKIGVLALSAFGFANMWLAVFADVGVAVIAILNSMRTMLKVEKSKQ